MADSDLPVFSFRQNWREAMIERLSFLTDVIRSEEGAEQRRTLRSTPRRYFEADLLLRGAERTFFDLFVNRLGGGEMMIPLYWDIATITSATEAAVTDRLEFDTSYHEFTVGGLAILSGKSARDYEVVEIAGIDAGGIDLTEAVGRAWPKGSRIMPLRRGKIDGSSPSLAHRAGAVGITTTGFVLTSANPWTPAEDPAPVYAGRPVYLIEPNWADGLDTVMDRETFTLDNEVGLPYQVDALNRMLAGQSHSWFMPGRQKLAAFRDLIYRHRGRAGSFWLPTFKHDLKMVAPITSMATTMVIEDVGFLYTGGVSEGREYIAIKHAGGTIIRRITEAQAGLIDGTERIVLDQSLGLALQPGQVLRISFADVARFDQDDFEITHHAGLDSLHEAQTIFRNFKDTRDPSGTISFPIPEAIEEITPCGVDEQPECYAVPVYEGWDYEWILTVESLDGGDVPSLSFYDMWYPDGSSIGPHFSPAVMFDAPVYNDGTTWVLRWRMLPVKPLVPGDYSMRYDPTNFPGLQRYSIAVRAWDGPALAPSLGSVTTSSSGAFTIPFTL